MSNRTVSQRPNGQNQAKICQFKLVLLGESAVGKSSLVLRFVKGQFHEFQESTIGGNLLVISAIISGVRVLICLSLQLPFSHKPFVLTTPL